MRLGNETNETMDEVVRELSILNPKFRILPVIYMYPPKEARGKVKDRQYMLMVGERNLIIDTHIGPVIYISKLETASKAVPFTGGNY